MKKLLTLLLALTTVLSLCACGPDQPSPSGTAQPEETTLPTEPSEPTVTSPAEPNGEERIILENYAYYYSVFAAPDYSANADELYQLIMNMDKSVIYRWRDTDYAPKFLNCMQINWDIDEVLGNFVCIENVLLRTNHTRKDLLGNATTYEPSILLYDVNGMVIKDDSDQYLNYTKDENGRVVEIRRTSNPAYGDVTVNYLTTIAYDENGNKIKETTVDKYGYSEETTYSYDSQNRLVRVDYPAYNGTDFYRYDDEGRLIEREAQTYNNRGKIYLKIIEKFGYDENGCLKTGVRTQNRYTDSYYSEPKLDTYRNDEIMYTCDENGNVVKEEIITGDTHYCADYMNGQVDKATSGPEIFEYIYGNFCIYIGNN